MTATYTYRNTSDGATGTIPYPSIWAALNRAEFDTSGQEQAPTAEPVSITTEQASFSRDQILALLEVWTDQARIRRE